MRFDVIVEGIDEVQREYTSTFLTRIKRGARQAVQRAAKRGEEVAKAHVNRSDKTEGTHLKDEIYSRVTGEVSGGDPAIEAVVVAPKSYSEALEGGTKAHVIEPRRAPMLAFKVNGSWVFAKKVNHPGTAPHPFMGPAAIAAEQRLEAELDAAVAAAAAAFNGGS